MGDHFAEVESKSRKKSVETKGNIYTAIISRLVAWIHATSHRLIVAYHHARSLFGDLAKQSPPIRVPLALAVLGVSV